MTYIDKIGIEHEFWLLDKYGKILEPMLHGFTEIDEFGFLIELRTAPSDYNKLLLHDYHVKHWANYCRAKHYGFELSTKPNMPRPEGFIEKLAKKYHYEQLKDLTANINSGVISSHATGVFDGHLTAGIHVHFSRHNQFGQRVQLPIETIVKKMDWNFRSIIIEAGRILGEYELKTYGFEYRSLPANTPIKEVINRAFKILRSVK